MSSYKKELDDILDEIEKVLEKFAYLLENSINVSIETPSAEIESSFINYLREIKGLVKENKELPESLQYPSREEYISKELNKYRFLK